MSYLLHQARDPVIRRRDLSQSEQSPWKSRVTFHTHCHVTQCSKNSLEMEQVLRDQKMLRRVRADQWVDGDGRRSSMTREDMLHPLGRVKDFVADKNNHDDLGHVCEIRK